MSAPRIIAKRFEIKDPETDLLGRGGMGDVYRGVDSHTGQSVAIKALRLDHVASDPDIVARFTREGEALRQLNHPNIVNMVAAVEDGGQHYLIIEYVEGGSLQELLENQGPLPIARTVEICLDLADALTRAHRLGIIHRDLKPANVLLAGDGTPRLTDFGIAYVADSPRLTQTDMLVGTLDYLSPEACHGEQLDARADIWAFGVLLYEMLTGQQPFAGRTITDTLRAILTTPAPDLSALCPEAPDALVDLVYRMLEKDRQQRIPSVRLVGAELEAILHDRATDTPRPAAPRGRFATPTPPTKAPQHAIRQQRDNLPTPPTPFVGREAELIELARLLADPDVRLVTILGVGGMGKTRLALEAVTAQLSNYEHGVYFASLAPLQSVDAIVPTVAKALGFSFYEGGTPRQQLLDYLRPKRLLLVLDNCEHLLDGVDLVADVLQMAPGVKILATSRVRLPVQGEQCFHLAGMNFPELAPAEADTLTKALEYSAVKLFLQSARRAQPGFELVADDLQYVARICRLVQGMPLGILLAAAWVDLLSLTEIADEIGQNLDFLETDLHDVPERQRSIRAIFDSSWSLLAEQERAVFQGLSVFRGGFTREAAQQVTNATLRDLMALVNKSLLRRTPAGRYEVHELLRQYAADMLAASPAAAERISDRHAAYYAALLQGLLTDLKGPRQRTAMAQIDAEVENIRAAWLWMVKRGSVDLVEQALEPLAHYYDWRFYWHEGAAAFRLAAEKLPITGTTNEGQIRLRVWLLAWQAHHSHSNAGRSEWIGQLLQQSLELLQSPALARYDSRREKAFILWVQGHIASNSQDARRCLEQSVALYEALDDRWEMGIVLHDLSVQVGNLGDYDQARRLAERSLALRRAVGDHGGVAYSLFWLGNLAARQGQLEKAEGLVHECIAIMQRMNDLFGLTGGYTILGQVLVLQGQFAAGQVLIEKSLATFTEQQLPYQMTWAATELALVQMHQGRYAVAHALVQTGFSRMDLPGPLADARLALGMVALAEESHLEAQQCLQECQAFFQEIGICEYVCWARAALGYTARELGRPAQARQYLYQALQTATEMGSFFPQLLALPAVALLRADRGEGESAVELYALASRYPFVAHSRWFEDVAGRHIAAIAATLPPTVVVTAQERGQTRDLRETVAELLTELKEISPDTE